MGLIKRFQQWRSERKAKKEHRKIDTISDAQKRVNERAKRMEAQKRKRLADEQLQREHDYLMKKSLHYWLDYISKRSVRATPMGPKHDPNILATRVAANYKVGQTGPTDKIKTEWGPYRGKGTIKQATPPKE